MLTRKSMEHINTWKYRYCVVWVVLGLLWSQTLLAQESHWIEISLQTSDGDETNIKEQMGEKGAILLFLDPDCPVSQKYGATIRQLSEQFKKEGIQTIAIYPVVNVEKEKIRTFAQEYQYQFVHLLDPKMELTREIEASVTPEVYLISNKGEVKYQGAINNWYYELGRYRRVVTEHYLKDALKAYLQNKPVALQKTEAIGCMIGTGMNVPMHH